MPRIPSLARPDGVLVARLFGIDLRVDPSWILSLALLSFFARDAIVPEVARNASQPVAWVLAIGFALAITSCIVLHELAHSLVAKAYRLPVRRITLFMFGGVSQIEREAPTPATEYHIALAGPLTSILLASVFAGVARASNPGSAELLGGWGWMAWVNLILAVFNLVPAFPMDGGRILRSALWAGVRSRARATRWAALAGRGFATAFIAFGVVSLLTRTRGGSLYSIMLGFFLYNAAQMAGVHEGHDRPNEPHR